MSWFVEGNAGNRDEFIKNAYHSKVNKFWLNKGETREVVFISDERFGVYEHTIPMNGRFETFTCAGGDCAFCGLQKPRGYAEYCSILDLTPYVTKDNKEKKVSRRALGVGKDISMLLDMRRKEAGGSLIGRKFRVTRIGDKSKTCGNDWSLVAGAPADLSKLPPELKPFDFKDALRPLPAAQIQSILNYAGAGAAPAAANSFSAGVSMRGASPAPVQTFGVSGTVDSFTGDSDIPF